MYTTVNYSVTVTVSEKGITPKPYTIEYPFSYGQFVCNGTNAKPVGISLDVSSDARFFVATSVLSILYCIFIAVVYAGLDEIYQTKPEVPLAVNTNQDFHIVCKDLISFFFFLIFRSIYCVFVGFHVNHYFGNILVIRFGCMVQWG